MKVGFVLHVMQVAGAEVLVAETIRRLGRRIEPVVFCLDGVGPLGDELIKEGVPVVALNRRQGGADLGVSRRMSKAIRERGLEVIHAHQYTPFFYGAIAARLAGGRRPRVIFTEHGRHYPDIVSLKRRVANRLVFDRLADDVNAVCEFSARALHEKEGFSASRIQVIRNGVDLRLYDRHRDRVSLRHRLQLDPMRKYIAMIARFHPVKDHRTMLSAFSEVARTRPDVDLLLVGDGPLRPDLEQQTRALAIDSRVRFMGVRNDVADILDAVDVFALTSVSEAASITLLEAMASARPVVVTAVGGNPEIVRDGLDGLLAARGDAHGIATAIFRLVDDEPLAAAMGRSGAERVRSHYRLEQTIERYAALYDLASGGRQAA